MKAYLRLTTIILIVACFLLAAACSPTQASPTPEPTTPPTPTQTPTPIPTPTPKPLTPEEIIEQSTLAAKDTPMHMVMDMTMNMNIMDQVMDITANMKLDANSSEEMKASMTLNMIGQTFTTETIIVDGKVYVKEPLTGNWTLSDQTPTEARQAADAIDLNSISEVTLVGEENIDGIPAYHFKAKVAFPASVTMQLGSAQGPMDIDYYVAKDTYLPIKMTGSGTLMFDVSGVQTDMAFTMDTTFSDWGQETEITAPIP